MPVGFTSDGLPATISFFGRAFSEPTLVGFAYAYEQATRLRSPSPLVPPLDGEFISYAIASKTGITTALTFLGIGSFGIVSIQHRQQRRIVN